MSFKTDSCFQKKLFLALTILAGIYILFPLLNFQHFLSTGDHGRDLYSFKKTLEGGMPYRDYSWLYGPLMPYYYSFFMAIGGVTIQSVLLGQYLMILAAGIFVYASCALYLSPAVAAICALWYWSFRGAEFFYTYNHIGALTTMVAVLFFLLRYTKKRRAKDIILGFACLFVLFLVRLNMGAFILIAFVLSILLADFLHKDSSLKTNIRLLIIGSCATVGLTIAIYGFFLYPLEDYALMQSLPYGKFQRTDYTPSAMASFILLIKVAWAYFTATPAQMALGALLTLTLVQCLLKLFSPTVAQEEKHRLLVTFGPLFLFTGAVSHEYMASGTFFRLVWLTPFFYIIGFYLITASTAGIRSKLIKTLIFTVLIIPPAQNTLSEHQKISAYKNPAHLFQFGENKIYTSQSPYWLRTVMDVAAFMKKYIPKKDTILTLPFDSLYLYLSGHQSVTRQLVFFEHINIVERQEEHIIGLMEQNSGHWVLKSSRAVALAPGMGIFGQTYCRTLSEYIDANFIKVAEFGDMNTPGGWGWDHGVQVFKRK